MTRLIDRLSGRRAALPDPEMVSMFASSWGGSRDSERMSPTFLSYALDGYASNPVVFAVENARLTLFTQAEFKYQDWATRRVFGAPSLGLLENPWPNGTSGDLLAKMEQHAAFAGNAFVWRAAPDRLVCLRPDWVEIVSMEVEVAGSSAYREVIGYIWREDGPGGDSEVFLPVEDVAHWAPIPDPVANYRGMSWLTPVLREVNADTSMTQHKQRFLENNATPNLVLRYTQPLNSETVAAIGERWNARYGGSLAAGSTAILDNGADLTVVGTRFDQMRFNEVQADGENRIAVAAGVPSIVAGLRAGLDASTMANYDGAYKAFANGTMTYLWRSAVAALAKFSAPPEGSRLWFDVGNIPALQDAETARAEAMATAASAISTLIQAGFKDAAAVSAVNAGDLSLLDGQHTGLVSVQMQKPGATGTPTP